MDVRSRGPGKEGRSLGRCYLTQKECSVGRLEEKNKKSYKHQYNPGWFIKRIELKSINRLNKVDVGLVSH